MLRCLLIFGVVFRLKVCTHEDENVEISWRLEVVDKQTNTTFLFSQ